MIRFRLSSLFLLSVFLSPQANAESGEEAAARVLAILQNTSHLPPAEVPASPGEAKISFVQLDPADSWSLGVLRVMRVRVPPHKMISVIDDIPAYVGLFKDLLVAKRTPAAGHEFVLFTETHIPLPLVANDRTSVRYHCQITNARRLTSFELVEGNHLGGLDGASLLLPLKDGESVYLQLSFVHVAYGMARALPVKMFWAENAMGSLQADWALKLRAEQPAHAAEEILEESEGFSRAQFDRIKAAFEKPRKLADFIASLKANKSP